MKDFQEFIQSLTHDDTLNNIATACGEMGVTVDKNVQRACFITSLAVVEQYHEWLNKQN